MKRGRLPAEGLTERAGLRPAHLLLLGTSAVMATSLFVTRDSSVVNVVAVAVAVATAALVAAAVYRTLMPLTGGDVAEQPDMLGGRTRAALEREKMLVLRSIKEIEFDHAMRKISAADYQDIVTRLRARAAGLIRQLDGESGYRDLIERDLAKTLGGAVPMQPTEVGPAPGTCTDCGIVNDADARFCKKCGRALGGRS